MKTKSVKSGDGIRDETLRRIAGAADTIVGKAKQGGLAIPDYEILRLIGKGSYGEVWLARAITGAMRAIKVVSRGDFEYDRTFEREFEGIRQFEPISREHAGVVDILHVGRNRDRGLYYYVMELGDDQLTGPEIFPERYRPRSLSTDLHQKRRLPVIDCISYGAELAGALQHLHSNGLSHRDIKPANVIFVDGRPKLADIGLVAASGQRTFVGTEGYVPPEGPGTPQADIYSLGMVLYEISTGKDRLDFPEVPDDLDDDERRLWRMLNQVVLKACESDPKKRYASAGEMRDALEMIVSSRARVVTPMGRFFRVGMLAALIGTAAVWARNQELITRMVAFHFDSAQSSLLVPVLMSTKVGNEPDGRNRSDRLDSLTEEPKIVAQDSMVPVAIPLTESAVLKVVVEPPGGQLFINGNEVATLQHQGYQESLAPGNYELEVRLEGFRTWKKSVALLGNGELIFVDGIMEVFDPPVSGKFHTTENEVDFVPLTDGSHRSVRPVSPAEFGKFSRQHPLQVQSAIAKIRWVHPTNFEPLSGQAVLTDEIGAREYCQWWTASERRAGKLSNLQQIVPLTGVESEFLEAAIFGQPMEPLFCSIKAVTPAILRISLNPEVSAGVYWNGELLGVTPIEMVELPPGPGSLTIHPGGYDEEVLNTEFFPGETRTIIVDLHKEEFAKLGERWERNSLGLPFVPVGNNLLVSAWETRVRDMDAYCEANGLERTHEPIFRQTPEDPAVLVSYEEAVSFCQWLTEKEHEHGLLPKDLEYRLPRDLEWSRMAGLIGEKSVGTPGSRDCGIKGEYPWGEDWPPPPGTGNFADESVRGRPQFRKIIAGYRDDFHQTAPVGTFAPNEFGIFDLAGNVQEWVEEKYGEGTVSAEKAVARGGSYNDGSQEILLSSHRNPLPANQRFLVNGFRVVIARSMGN